MFGAIAGDIIGSVYEARPIKTTDFPLFSPGCRFTDDTVLTVAVAYALLQGSGYVETFKEYYRLYPHAGYGGAFSIWASSVDNRPYLSWGNGSAMRVSPVGFALDNLDDVLDEAKRTAEVTHNHPEGIKSAQAVAAAIFLARTSRDMSAIKEFVEQTFHYDLNEPLDSIRQWYHFDVSCQGTVPQALRAFLESTDYEDAVRNAISLGGDSDTLACITGGIAQAYYGKLPPVVISRVRRILDQRLNGVVDEFMARFPAAAV
ncbi:MAG: ADP-ribosylglycohydrolase family protein [Desulfomonile sp.]|nr:ADP-ribosylglycohydrolase family protein [Desulfomonile sp.]